MRSPIRACLAAALASALVLLSACNKPQANGPAAAASAAPAAPQVGTVTLAAKPVTLQTELPGRTAPVLIADVRPQVTGLIKSRNFKEGSEVKAGDVLYQIDPATYRVAVDSARAALAKAESSLKTTKIKADRYKELVEIQAVSKQDNDDQRSMLGQGDADVATAKAALESSQINLAYTRVTSPISGRIGISSVTPGALVTANQTTALATVQKLDPIYVDVTQSSTALLKLRRALAAGQLKSVDAQTAKVDLLLEDGSRYAFAGKLQFSDVTVDQSTGAVTLRAEFPNPKNELLPGMYVRALLEEAVDEKGLLVPQQGVSRDAAGKPMALVVGADGKVQQRSITTDRAVGDQWLVSSGLAAGDKVIVEGVQKAKPGAAVQAVDYVASAPAAAASAASAPSAAASAASEAPKN